MLPGGQVKRGAAVEAVTRAMKILMVSLYFHPDRTGVPKYSGEMARWLAQRGHEVTVVAGVPHYPYWKRSADHRAAFTTEQWDGVTIHRVPHYVPNDGKINTLRRMLIDASFLMASSGKWLRMTLRRQEFDIAIAVCPPLFSGLLSYVNQIVRGVPWVFHVQDFQVDAAIRLNLLNGGRLGRLLYALEGHLLGAATQVASITPAMCRRAVEKGADNSRVYLLPNWGDVQGIRPIAADGSFRRALGASPSDTVVMYAGAMGAKQGLDLVLDVADRLGDRKDIRFVMVGGGPEWIRLCENAGERGLHNVQFIPLQPSERLNEMLASADVHLVVQKAEAADIVMPSKLTNVFAAGRPAIATAEPGTALYKAMTDSGGGIVIPPQVVDDLHDAMVLLADDPALRERMGKAARAYAERELDQNKILEQFERELSRIASERPSGGVGAVARTLFGWDRR